MIDSLGIRANLVLDKLGFSILASSEEVTKAEFITLVSNPYGMLWLIRNSGRQTMMDLLEWTGLPKIVETPENPLQKPHQKRVPWNMMDLDSLKDI